MIKKLFSISISFVYLIITIGITFNVHYCNGKVNSISFFENNDICCCESDIDASCNISGDCCKNEYYLFQFLPENQLLSFNLISFNNTFSILKQNLTIICLESDKNNDIFTNNIDLSDFKLIDKFIQNCSLLYYG
ncbi:MAG: hypothetical protein JXR51_08900 [Bacteroidales bacterium]|nr:hypothetical protein [Bacteroidales bacterium]MBN2757282.1 hypothetical protein [Bacteroidales bacterium]